MRSGSDYAPSMPKVVLCANAGMLNPVLAYHADDEIARAVATGEIVIGVLLVVIGIALLWRLRGAPAGGRNGWARAAAAVASVGIAAYLLYHFIPESDDPSNAVLGLFYALLLLMMAVGVGAPFVAILGLGNVRDSGERRLAVAAFVASLVLPGIFFANLVACAVTDACFH
jgi:hypothetical protein